MSVHTKLRKLWNWLNGSGLKIMRPSARRTLSLEALEDRMLMTGGIPGPLGYGDVKMQLATLPALSIPVLHSIDPKDYTPKTATLFLDFDGQEPMDFGVGVGPITFNLRASTPRFDLDGNYSVLSQVEVDAIREIQARVSEDYAPFNIDVTTVDPGNRDDGKTLAVSIGGTGDWHPTAGIKGTTTGIGLPSGFTNSLSNVVFVFSEKIDSVAGIADTVSHESGHGFGLYHLADYNNGKAADGLVNEYSQEILPERDKLMSEGGSGLKRSTWWTGLNSLHEIPTAVLDVVVGRKAGEFQIDMDWLLRYNPFGERADETNVSFDKATVLTPNAAEPTKGIIGKLDDVDYFSFDADGWTTIDVRLPRFNSQIANLQDLRAGKATAAYENRSIGNLDAVLKLYDSKGNLVETADPPITDDPTVSGSNALGGLDASIRRNLAPGKYYAAVMSVAKVHGTTNHWGDVGQYSISVKDTGGPHVEDSKTVFTPTSVRVTFSEPIDAASLRQLGAVHVTNPRGVDTRLGAITEVTGSGGRTFVIPFSPFPEGGYRITVGRQVTDRFGNALDQDDNGFSDDDTVDSYTRFDFNGAWVSSHEISAGRIRVTFNEAIYAPSFTADDVVLSDPSGKSASKVKAKVQRVDGVVGAGNNVFDILFDHFPANGYKLQVGPGVLDYFGNPMNQNRTGSNANTNGQSTDLFETSFTDTLPPPRVVGSAVWSQPSGASLPVAVPIGTVVQLTFNKAIDPLTVNANTVSIVGPKNVRGMLLGFDIVPSSISATTPQRTYNLRFTAAVDGTYTVTLLTGITDLFGKHLDQHGNTTSGQHVSVAPSKPSNIPLDRLGELAVKGLDLINGKSTNLAQLTPPTGGRPATTMLASTSQAIPVAKATDMKLTAQTSVLSDVLAIDVLFALMAKDGGDPAAKGRL